MNLKTNQISNLNKVVKAISRLEGVIGILLFGSIARGDYDEYSDYDLLIIFKDKSSMWKSWDNLFKDVSSLKMNLHIIPKSLEEFKTANPVFLEELSNHGKILFARFPYGSFFKTHSIKAFLLNFLQYERFKL
ncbi:MAG: nucleotidyltransferase domain-containing protein [Candidatus Bathyarchaeia archaeon]